MFTSPFRHVILLVFLIAGLLLLREGEGHSSRARDRVMSTASNKIFFVISLLSIFVPFLPTGLPPLRGAPPRRGAGGGGRDRQTIWKYSERLIWKAWKTKKKGWKVI